MEWMNFNFVELKCLQQAIYLKYYILVRLSG